MKVSAINSIPLRPAFGNNTNENVHGGLYSKTTEFLDTFQNDRAIERANTVLAKSMELAKVIPAKSIKADDNVKLAEDGQPIEKKSKLSTAISVLGALASSFTVAYLGAGVLLKTFPSLTPKISKFSNKALGVVKNGIKKLNGSKVAKNIVNSNFVQNSKNKVKPFVEKLSQSRLGNVAKKTTKPFFEHISTAPIETKIKSAVGIGSALTVGTRIATVDKNGDGVADIAQKNINAYENAIGTIKVIGDIVGALS